MLFTNKKGHRLNDGLQNIVKKFTSYFSSWIENLGVVPLFLLAAFLLAPIFFFLFALFVFVIRVFETITNLLNIYFKNFMCSIKAVFLHVALTFVKALVLLSLPNNLSAQNYETIIISKGEHYKQTVKNIKRYTIGNKEIVKGLYNPKTQVILLKGSKLGFTELIIWKKNNTEKKIKVFVISKTKQLLHAQIAQSLKPTNLKVSLNGNFMRIEGIVKDVSSWVILNKIVKDQDILLDVTIHKLLVNKLIGDIYKVFFDAYIDSISCDVKSIYIYCQYQHPKDMKDFHKRFSELPVVFSRVKNSRFQENFQAHLKVIQISSKDQKDHNLSINNLTGNISDVFEQNFKNLISQNDVLLKNQNLKVSTIASQTAILKTESPLNLQIGAEIPYKMSEKKRTKIVFKFAGIQFNLNIKKIGHQHTIDYKTVFTRPEPDGSITGSKEHSSLNVMMNKSYKIFEIRYMLNSKVKDSLPVLGSVPILKTLFESTKDEVKFITITGVLKIEKLN